MSSKPTQSLTAPESTQMNPLLTPLTAKLHLAAEFRANVTEHPGMLPKDENTWVHERDIAGGYNGEITLQKCMGHNKVRAVKRIKNRKSETENILRELEAIANFSGSEYLDCFVEVFCWYEDKENNYVYIAMEYVAPGDLSDHINGPLHEAEVKVIMYQLFKAVAYLHERGIAHRDLKPENVLVVESNPRWKVKVADFGLSKNTEASELQVHSQRGNWGPYIAPEQCKGYLDFGQYTDLYLNDNYTVTVDLWSLGAMMFKMLTGNPPFPDAKGLASYCRGETELPKKAWETNSPSLEVLSSGGFYLVERLLSPRPLGRVPARLAADGQWCKPVGMELRLADNKKEPEGLVRDAVEGVRKLSEYVMEGRNWLMKVMEKDEGELIDARAAGGGKEDTRTTEEGKEREVSETEIRIKEKENELTKICNETLKELKELQEGMLKVVEEAEGGHSSKIEKMEKISEVTKVYKRRTEEWNELHKEIARLKEQRREEVELEKAIKLVKLALRSGKLKAERLHQG